MQVRCSGAPPQANSHTALPTLDVLRGEIDRIDDAMLDLIERRASLSATIAASKRGDGRLKLRPRREAEVVDRLTHRAGGVGAEMIADVWRTLMSRSLDAQAPMDLVLAEDGDAGETARLAIQDAVRLRFGPAPRLRWAADADEALRAARDTEAVALIVLPHAPRPDDVLVVFDAVCAGNHTAYAIGRIAPEDVVPREHKR